ncbi:MAG: undecaprenyl-diphosphate phosphatase [Nitrospirota bacterium]|nr:undecaprenyl-diphosphate phosphatase [Nitrospirota bacterium]
MGYVEAIVLAVIQGLTEFLPVSSSGHLVIAQHWFGEFSESNLLYDVMLHMATVTAILLYFWQDLLTLAKGYVGLPTEAGSLFQGCERQTIHYVILASVPTAIIGLGVKLFGFEKLATPSLVAVMFLVTGIILWVARGGTSARTAKEMRPWDALLIGLIQGVAVLPGISRSGSTIAGGMVLGLDRELAARFSLLISIPAIAGATLLEIIKVLGQDHDAIGVYVLGMGVAALVGYWSIGVILRLVRQNHFYLFSYYLWPLGIGILLWSFLKPS